ncbi:hypothetical protein CPB85DRAFT_156590 [Mucidula mucida]|nr:hypothetical protein CPB85DRAFT_156590 [Mucidula mucida]
MVMVAIIPTRTDTYSLNTCTTPSHLSSRCCPTISSQTSLALQESQALMKLAKICPTHTSWSDCYTDLKAILVWGQTPKPEISLFPWPRSFHGHQSTDASRACTYPCVKQTARRFADPDTQERLRIALEALREVLDNAENVDGVLMPDLEKPNAQSAQASASASELVLDRD